MQLEDWLKEPVLTPSYPHSLPSQLMGAGVPPHVSSCSLTGNTAVLGAERIPTIKCGDLRSVIFLYFLPTELTMSLRQNLAVWRKFNHRHFGDHLLSFWGTKVLEVKESSGGDIPFFILGSSLLMFWTVAADFSSGNEPERQSFQQLCFYSVTSYYLKDYPCASILNKRVSLCFPGFPGGWTSVGFQARPFPGVCNLIPQLCPQSPE